MFRRIVATALLAGLAAGIIVSAAQLVWVEPLILEAETFENAAQTQDSGQATPAQAAPDEAAAGADVDRLLLTFLSNLLTGVGFALVLVAAITISGRQVDWRRGLIWGAAGFLCFAAAPALGLPPDPPGVDAGPLAPRQAWWLGTALATALGLWLLAFAGRRELRLLGIIVLAIPHVVGAPHVDISGAPTPPALIEEFIVASLVTSAAFWLVLGGVSGLVYRKLA